jgi:hypothetical protein
MHFSVLLQPLRVHPLCNWYKHTAMRNYGKCGQLGDMRAPGVPMKPATTDTRTPGLLPSRLAQALRVEQNHARSNNLYGKCSFRATSNLQALQCQRPLCRRCCSLWQFMAVITQPRHDASITYVSQHPQLRSSTQNEPLLPPRLDWRSPTPPNADTTKHSMHIEEPNPNNASAGSDLS